MLIALDTFCVYSLVILVLGKLTLLLSNSVLGVFLLILEENASHMCLSKLYRTIESPVLHSSLRFIAYLVSY